MTTGLDVRKQVDEKLLDEIYTAVDIIEDRSSPVLPTELSYDDILSEQYQANIWLASELHQPIGAYKIRGAFNLIQQLSELDKKRGVVTASAGNHAQGIALSCRNIDVPCEIFMPVSTPQQKIEKVSYFGGDQTVIRLVGDTFDSAQAAAEAFAESTNQLYASPFNDLKVIAGQGSWGVEIADSIDQIDYLFCPVGGMGLLAGISSAIKARSQDTQVVAVEPAGAASLKWALIHGKPTRVDKIDTYVDGAAVQQVGELPFQLAAHLVDTLTLVTNQELRAAITQLWKRNQPVKAELAGALSIAGLRENKETIVGKNVVCLVTGGNLSYERYSKEVETTGKA